MADLTCARCPNCGQEDVDGVRWIDMVDECIADVCPVRDGVGHNWEQRELDIDVVEEALDPYLRKPGNDQWSPHDLVSELSAAELLDVLHRAGLLNVPTRPYASGVDADRA